MPSVDLPLNENGSHQIGTTMRTSSPAAPIVKNKVENIKKAKSRPKRSESNDEIKYSKWIEKDFIIDHIRSSMILFHKIEPQLNSTASSILKLNKSSRKTREIKVTYKIKTYFVKFNEKF
jgi:hypothetical protein